ncbi:MAG: hypothetical protein AAFN77_16390 [Planctomycetota bacterium]
MSTQPTRFLTLACIAALTCLLAVQSVVAQSDGSIPRANPSPWRPAFSSVDLVAGPRVAATNQPKSIVTQPNNASGNSGPSAAGSTQNQTQSTGSTATSQSRANLQQPGITRVTRDMTRLSNAAGQIWREYDITPYTSQIKTSDQPEKAVIDWVLRETGTEMWFTQPMGVLSVDRDKLYVYHTPEIHAVVKGIVDRFVRTRGQVQTIDVSLVTVTKPNWRSQAYTMLQPIDVKSPGVEAWLVSKENAAILLGQLSRRSDFKQHSGGRLTNHDGQSFTLDKTRPVQFIRNLKWTPNQVPNFQPLLTTLNEGYKLQLSCLTSVDNASIEATIKCDVDQVEKLNDVRIDIPLAGGGTQPMTLQVPQLVSWRLHERFRWPSDEVLVLSCGVVANPEPEARTGGINFPGLSRTTKRADALLFIDYRGPATGATVPQTTQRSPSSQINRGQLNSASSGMRPINR